MENTNTISLESILAHLLIQLQKIKREEQTIKRLTGIMGALQYCLSSCSAV
jgi:flagellin-specific chaperone FliS